MLSTKVVSRLETRNSTSTYRLTRETDGATLPSQLFPCLFYARETQKDLSGFRWVALAGTLREYVGGSILQVPQRCGSGDCRRIRNPHVRCRRRFLVTNG